MTIFPANLLRFEMLGRMFCRCAECGKIFREPELSLPDDVIYCSDECAERNGVTRPKRQGDLIALMVGNDESEAGAIVR